MTIAEMLEDAGVEPRFVPYCRVWLSDEAMTSDPVQIQRRDWDRVRPKPGIVITLRAAPRGGGGGKSILGIVLGLATLALGFVLGPLAVGLLGGAPALGATGASLVSGLVVATTSIVGKLLISALIPPAVPAQTQPAGIQASPTYAIGGMRNVANLYGKVPRLYGRHKIAPPYAAAPYTEIAGDDVYLHALFGVTGPLLIEDIKIGETAIAAYEEVQYEVRQGFPGDAPITLVTNGVLEQAMVKELSIAAGFVQATTEADCDRISGDITFDKGLTNIDPKTGYHSRQSVAFSLQYRAVGSTGGWLAAPGLLAFTVTRDKTSLCRFNFSFAVTRGQYDVQLKRTSAEHPGIASIFDHAVWTALRTIRNVKPIALPGLALIAVKIKASGQLNGIIDQLTFTGTSILDVHDGAGWSLKPTRTPAWIYLDILRGSANKRPPADSRIYFPDFYDWADDSDAAGRTCDVVFDTKGTVMSALQVVAAAGRASFGMRDGMYSIVRDVAQSVTVQHFTPRNSRNFTGTKTFIDQPHALKIQFINEQADWVQDELIVYADGYNIGNASKFETLSLVGAGITNPTQVFRHARYMMAQAILRPEVYEISTDIEHVICRRGDLVRVVHDVPLWGLGSGRIKSLTLNGGGSVTAITCDEVFSQFAGKSYVARIRKDDGTSVLANVSLAVGDSPTLTMATPISGAAIPDVGDLLMFGESGKESVELIVTKITPEPDFGARLTLVDAAPAVFNTGAIPDFNPRITRPPVRQALPPKAPVVAAIASDESVLTRGPDGRVHPRILITLARQSGITVPAVQIEAQMREAGDGSYRQVALAGGADAEISVYAIDDLSFYDIRLRAVSAAGVPSAWTYRLNYQAKGGAAPPPNVAALTIAGNILSWTYPNPPRDMAPGSGGGFRVKYRMGTMKSWGDGLLAFDGLLTVTHFDMSKLPGGLMTLMVSAVDAFGHESTAPASLVVTRPIATLPPVVIHHPPPITVGDAILQNIVLTEDFAAEGFPGTIVNGFIGGGQVKASAAGQYWSGNPGKRFWTGNRLATFWGMPSYEEMSYTAVFRPSGGVASGRLTFDYQVSSDRFEVLYRAGNTSLYWSGTPSRSFWSGIPSKPFWSPAPDFTPWPGAFQMQARRKFEIKVVTGPGPVQGVISQLAATLDVPDLVESIDNTVIAPGGTRLPIVGTYAAIKNVRLSLLDDGGTAVNMRVIDKDTVGPLVKCFNAAGASVAGLVDAKVQGYA